MARDMGPKLAVPCSMAGGAVEEPAPWIWMLTLGYCFLKDSAHSVIRLFSESEPMLDRLPDTPVVLV